MRSSTSSSESAVAPAAEGTRPPARAAGSAPENTYWVQPLPERRVPQVTWGTAAIAALTLFVCALGTWEWQMRRLGLLAGDLGPTRGAWATERRKIDRGGVPIAIVGSSRGLFGTDLDVFEQVAGIRPVQLALQGSSTRKFMADLAADPDFRGLLIVDATPLNFYISRAGLFDDALEYVHDQTLSQRSDHWLDQQLQRYLAYMDGDYRLMKIVERETHLPEREGVRGPTAGVWKVATTFEGRQSFTWDRLRHDPRLRAHAVSVWQGAMGRAPALSLAEIDAVIADTRRDVEAIRARGGDVVFLRPPSSGKLAAIESTKFPRESVWERLLAGTQARGFHYADHAETRGVTCVEESHLSRADAAAFTRAYAAFLRPIVEERRQRAGPAPVVAASREPHPRHPLG